MYFKIKSYDENEMGSKSYCYYTLLAFFSETFLDIVAFWNFCSFVACMPGRNTCNRFLSPVNKNDICVCFFYLLNSKQSSFWHMKLLVYMFAFEVIYFLLTEFG